MVTTSRYRLLHGLIHVIPKGRPLPARIWEQRPGASMKRPGRGTALILNSAGEGICGVDQRGTIEFINPAGARLPTCLKATTDIPKPPMW
jgi:hypothetical protein